MKKTSFLVLVTAFFVTSTAIASTLPSYYPPPGYPAIGYVHSVISSEGTVVMNDSVHRVSASVVVHSLSSFSDSLARIRPGARVAFRANSNGEITEFWLLPKNYDPMKLR